MEPGAPATTNNGEEPPAPAAEPSAAATTATTQAAAPAAAAAAAEPSSVMTNRAAGGAADEKAAYRGAPAARPGVQSVPAAAPAAPAAAAAAAAEPAAAAVGGGGASQAMDEKARYRAAPATKPGAMAAPNEPAAAATTGGGGGGGGRSLDEKAAYRAQPATRPGVMAEPAPAAAAAVPALAASEPGAVAPISPAAAPVADEKAAFRAAPAVRPGVQTMEPATAATTPAAASTTSPDEKSAYRAMPASRPGAMAAPAAAGAGAAVGAAALASEPGAAATTSSGQGAADEKAAFRAAAPPPATTPGVISAADASATVQAVESDLMAKQRVGPNRAAGPGVTSSSNSDDRNNAYGAKMAAAGGVAAAAALGGAAAAGAMGGGSSGGGDAAVTTAATTPYTAQTSPATPASLAAVNQDAVVASMERDLLAKKEAAAPAVPATTPGVVSGDDDAARESQFRSRMEAKIFEMEQETIRANDALIKQAAAGGGAAAGGAAPEEAPPSMSMDYGKSTTPELEHGLSKGQEVEAEEEAEVEQGEEGGNDLAVAVAVDEDAELEQLAKGETFDPNLGRPVYYQPWFVALLACVLLSCIGGIIAGAVVGSKDDDDNPSLVDAPTMAPTMAPTSSDEVYLRQWLKDMNVSQATIDTAPTAYEMAIDWYVNEDRARDLSIPGQSYPWDITRFVLAWFYFAASSNGTKPWVSCNKPNYDIGENDTCTELRWKNTSPDQSYINYTQVPKQARWLSRFGHCDWPGITCFPEDNFDPDLSYADVCGGAVHSLRLVGVGLSGQFPIVVNQLPCFVSYTISFNADLTGTISPEFFNFRSEHSFNFYQNFLIANLSLTGPLPGKLWELPGLRNVQMGDTGLTSVDMPRVNIYPDSGFEALTTVWFFGERMGGPLPVFAEYPLLEDIHLYRDQLGYTGTIPTEYATLDALQSLWLNENLLTGPFPDEFVSLQKMTSLRLQRNRLNGTLPDLLWPELLQFEVRTNDFEGQLPPRLAGMTKLQHIVTEENRLTGTIDPAIGNNLNELREFLIADNRMNGTIPESLGNLAKLTTLWLHYNEFQDDELPISICRRRSVNGLAFIVADCLAYPPVVYCYCCTSCCDLELETCQRGDVEKEDQLERRLLMAKHDEGADPVDRRMTVEETNQGKRLRQVEPHYFAEHYDKIDAALLENVKDWEKKERALKAKQTGTH